MVRRAQVPPPTSAASVTTTQAPATSAKPSSATVAPTVMASTDTIDHVSTRTDTRSSTTRKSPLANPAADVAALVLRGDRAALARRLTELVNHATPQARAAVHAALGDFRSRLA